MGAETAHRILWTSSNMALLGRIAAEFETTRPFAGLRIGVSLHLEVKTAVLLLALKAGGADIVATGNYGTSQDDVVAYLNDPGHRRPRQRFGLPRASPGSRRVGAGLEIPTSSWTTVPIWRAGSSTAISR